MSRVDGASFRLLEQPRTTTETIRAASGGAARTRVHMNPPELSSSITKPLVCRKPPHEVGHPAGAGDRGAPLLSMLARPPMAPRFIDSTADDGTTTMEP